MKQASNRSDRQRVLFIGGGIAGVASAWALSKSGDFDCMLLEREAQLGAHSTSKNASILRTLTECESTMDYALETAEFLRNPPAGFSATPLLDEVGFVLIQESIEAELVREWLAKKAPGSVQALSPEELHELLPHWAGQNEGALLVRDEGNIDTSALLDGLVREAKLAGTRFLLEAEVLEIVKDRGRVCGVRLAGGQHVEADVVVLAAGGWAGRLGQAAGSLVQLEARRRHLLVTAPEERVNPRWPILWSEPDGYYMRPESGGLMICACDQDVIDPDDCEALEEVREHIAVRTAECLPEYADAPVGHFWAGMRTFAKGPELELGFDAQVEGLFWVAGLGGHGMSTSVGFGRKVAGLIKHGAMRAGQRL